MNRAAGRQLFLLATLLAGIPRPATADEPRVATNHIASLTPEQARKLVADFKGGECRVAIGGTVYEGLPLEGLKTLDADTAKILAEFKGSLLRLNGLTRLDADTAQMLAQFKGGLLWLNGLTTIDADTARALAKFQGDWLELNGLKTIDAETAKVLCQYTERLFLNGLTTFDAKTAKALAESKGELWLGCLTPLDADTFKEIAHIRGWNGELGITAFDFPDSIAIATALAKRQGPLSLPNLRKISPKTLQALIAKGDVKIPPIDSLELIAEPDGSATDDVVIPDEFQTRRQPGR